MERVVKERKKGALSIQADAKEKKAKRRERASAMRRAFLKEMAYFVLRKTPPKLRSSSMIRNRKARFLSPTS